MTGCTRRWSFPHGNRLQAHQAHQAAHPFAIDLIALPPEGCGHFGPAREGRFQVLGIDPPHQFQI
jgi:hypothetical protein